eukprot:4273380-Amphidinium_carterae.1
MWGDQPQGGCCPPLDAPLQEVQSHNTNTCLGYMSEASSLAHGGTTFFPPLWVVLHHAKSLDHPALLSCTTENRWPLRFGVSNNGLPPFGKQDLQFDAVSRSAWRSTLINPSQSPRRERVVIPYGAAQPAA